MLHRRIRDARRTLRRVPPPAWDHGAPSERPADRVVSRIRAAIYGVPSGLGRRIAGGAACGLGVGLMALFAARNAMDPVDSARIGPFLAVLLGLAAAWGFFRVGVAPPRYEAAARMIALNRVCICCGYDLAGLPPDPDGLTTCPECAAAWRLPSPDPPHPSPPAPNPET
jgi:hypothetical protein